MAHGCTLAAATVTHGYRLHYFRIPFHYWRDRLQRSKTLGCNSVQVRSVTENASLHVWKYAPSLAFEMRHWSRTRCQCALQSFSAAFFV